MKFSAFTTAFCLASTAFASPVAVDQKAARAEASQAPSLPNVDGVNQGLLAKLAPGVMQLVTGLGLAGLAGPLGAVVTSLSTGLKVREEDAVDESEVPEIEGLNAEQAKQVYSGLKSIVEKLGLDKVKSGEKPKVDGIVGSVLDKVVGAVAGLLQKLGLSKLAPGLKPPVAREAPSPGTGLLAQLAAPLGGLVTALGLGTLAPGLISLLTSLSEGL